MALQHINRELTRNERGYGRNARVGRLLFHHLDGRVSSMFVCVFRGSSWMGEEFCQKPSRRQRGIMC